MKMWVFIFILAISQTFAFDVDETLHKLSRKEKIAQLFVAPAVTSFDESHEKDLIDLIKTYKIGGILSKFGSHTENKAFIENLQNHSETPLLVYMDAESSALVDDVEPYPKALEMGTNVPYFAKKIAEQCRYLGVHVNLAPIVDINTNPNNPIINKRAFGATPELVIKQARCFLKGMQNEQVACCLKHFPGHGDVNVDSHVDLPILSHEIDRLKRIEFAPFQALIDEGAQYVMIAHLFVPCICDQPTSLSKEIVDILRNDMNFQGLIISDALNMKALTNYYSCEQIAIQAFKAGIDILLYGDHISKSVDHIINTLIPKAIDAIDKSDISDEDIYKRVKKALHKKKQLLDSYRALEEDPFI